MPVVSDPKAKYPYVLDSDMDKPIDQRPIFFFKTWTVRQYRLQNKKISSFTGGKENDEVFNAAISLITEALVDWHNVRVPGSDSLLPFNPDDKGAIEDIVGVNELMELAHAVINQDPDAETKKKLLSQSTSPPDSAGQEPAGE